MNEVFQGLLVTFVVLLLMARMVLLLNLWPSARARVWPWLRLRRWWPIPSQQRAEALLRELLTDSELGQLRETGFLEIASPSRPDRVYRVPRGPDQVLVLERGHVIERLCVQPAESGLPEADVLVMHKLLILSDEEAYLRTANHFPVRVLWESVPRGIRIP
jgi:hypothetical protein